MVRRSNTASTLFAVATLVYGLNCGLGGAAATKLLDTSSFRWLHHALYIATCTASVAAVLLAWWSGGHANRKAALTLLPAAVPLGAIPYVETHGRRHPLVALTAAPFFLASLACSYRPTDRK